jgi:hypothetical protein
VASPACGAAASTEKASMSGAGCGPPMCAGRAVLCGLTRHEIGLWARAWAAAAARGLPGTARCVIVSARPDTITAGPRRARARAGPGGPDIYTEEP